MQRRIIVSMILLLMVLFLAVGLAQPGNAAVALTLDDMAKVRGGWKCGSFLCGESGAPACSGTCLLDPCPAYQKDHAVVADCGLYPTGNYCNIGRSAECGRMYDCYCSFLKICTKGALETSTLYNPCP